MKKLMTVLMMLSCAIMFVFISSCAVRRSEPIKQEEFTPSTEQVKKGEEHYMHHCQKCHPAGESGLGPAINSNPAPMFLKRFQVRHGLGVMPSFRENEISKKDLKAIAVYLKQWKKY